jgi:hypothetical protein
MAKDPHSIIRLDYAWRNGEKYKSGDNKKKTWVAKKYSRVLLTVALSLGMDPGV